MTPNECHAARYLAVDGYTLDEIGNALDIHRDVVGRHLREECSCPNLDEPREIPAVDCEELCAVRKAEGLTQEELASLAESSYATISQIERGTTSPSAGLRLRFHDWFDSQE